MSDRVDCAEGMVDRSTNDGKVRVVLLGVVGRQVHQNVGSAPQETFGEARRELSSSPPPTPVPKDELHCCGPRSIDVGNVGGIP